MTGRARPLRGAGLAALALALALVLALATGGCGSDARAPTTTTHAAAHARLLRAGARVFAEHCRTCHPLLGLPNTVVHGDYAPPLDLDDVRPTAAYASAIVEDGKVAMSSLRDVLDERERRAVVAYVLAVGGRDAGVPRGTPARELAAGRGLYDEHCGRCHALAGRPATRGNPIWVGTDFDQVRPGVLYVERMVRDGQTQAMPSFRDRLTRDQIRAVALYLNATARGGR